jgi:hypothetical protein
MHTQLKKDDASLQKKSSDRHQESRSHDNQNSDLLSGESTEGFTSAPSQTLPSTGQGQLVMQCKGLSENPEPTKISGQLIQRRVNNTGLPDNLKNGIENLSGYAMDDVTVHYNSSKPAQLRAHAYTQGTAIHVAPGQQQHLPHEAWHVVQQKQGRVKPTLQMKGKVNVNDDGGLEREADVMGERAIRYNGKKKMRLQNKKTSELKGSIAQLKRISRFVEKFPGLTEAFRVTYDEEDQLAAGAEGKIYKGTRSDTDEKVAIKVAKPEEISAVKQEIAIYKAIGNKPGVAKCLGYNDRKGILVMELMHGSMVQQKNLPLFISKRLELFIEVWNTVKTLHNRNITHGDLGLKNILIKNKKTTGLADFGSSVAFGSNRTFTKPTTGHQQEWIRKGWSTQEQIDQSNTVNIEDKKLEDRIGFRKLLLNGLLNKVKDGNISNSELDGLYSKIIFKNYFHRTKLIDLIKKEDPTTKDIDQLIEFIRVPSFRLA